VKYLHLFTFFYYIFQLCRHYYFFLIINFLKLSFLFAVPKKRKVNNIVEDYFEKSLKFKKEKEDNLEKRHKERITRLSNIENLITEMLKK